MNPYYLSFRLVRFKLTQDTYELLITNLTKNEFAVNELKELYSMRWGIETSFRDLKYSLALSYINYTIKPFTFQPDIIKNAFRHSEKLHLIPFHYSLLLITSKSPRF